MEEGLCKLAKLVRFDKKNKKSEPIGRVINNINEEPRNGVLKEPAFLAPDAYFCEKTEKVCIACNINSTNVMDLTYCTTCFNREEAKKCPLYSPIQI